MRRGAKYLLFTLMSLLMAGCDRTIHEYPRDVDVELAVRCSVDYTMPEYWMSVECNAQEGASYVVRTQGAEPLGTRFTELVCLRYVVDLYRVYGTQSQFVERRVLFADAEEPSTQVVARFDVDAAKYRVLVWCDYVKEDVREAWYYITDDLRAVRYSDVAVVDNNDKDAFSGAMDVDLSHWYSPCNCNEAFVNIALERPKGRLKCVATDVDDYLAANSAMLEDITAVVSYVQYVSAGYNVEEQRPNYFVPTRTFVSRARVDREGKFELFYDYVFVNGKETKVMLNFAFYNGDVEFAEGGEVVGQKISSWSGIEVPLRRNRETVIEGRLLTTSFGTGGVGIDPGFENEYVIEI